MRLVLTAILSLFLLAAADAVVVKLAPDFTFIGAGEKARTLRSLRGQSVVLVITDRAKRGNFKKQLTELQGLYQELASEGVVIIAAIGSGEDPIPTNMPVTIANNGAGIAATYGMKKDFHIAVIGRDGNVDYESDKWVPGQRVRDIIQNSFEVQIGTRRTVN